MNIEKHFTTSELDSIRYGHEVGSTCNDCGAESGWVVATDYVERWENAHRCSKMVERHHRELDASKLAIIVPVNPADETNCESCQ